MADWNAPLLTTAYASFLSIMKDRDFDAISLGLNTPTNPVTGMIRYVRATNKFQEYDGAVWNDKSLSIAGGGTGAANAADARTNLGLGTLATQNASAVVITGGVIAGLGSLGVSGDSTLAGSLITGSGAVALTHANGKLNDLSAANLQNLSAAVLTGYVAANMAAGSTFPAISGINLTALNASNLASGTVNTARLGSGVANINTVLRGDNTWGTMQMIQSIISLDIAVTGDTDVPISPPLTDYTKAFASFIGVIATAGGQTEAKIDANNNFRIREVVSMKGTIYIIEFK